MTQIAIVADDITGASDSGVQLAMRGYQTLVLFQSENLHQVSANMDAIVLDTDSRALPSGEAYQRVYETAKQIRAAGITKLYKKVDSTLRGNLGVEIDAVLDAFSYDFAVIAPAFPRMGRTTKDGIHYLDGLPIHLTEIAKDPKCPVLESDLVKMLNSQSKRKAGLLQRSTLQKGLESFINEIGALQSSGVELVIVDAETDEDLSQLSRFLHQSNFQTLLVGSAGLAEFLPELFQLQIGIQELHRISSSENPVLLVAGSASQITREQIERFCQEPQVTQVKLDPLQVIGPERERAVEIWRCASLLQVGLAQGNDGCLYAEATPAAIERTGELGARFGKDQTQISNEIAKALGDVTAKVMEQQELQGLILTGGDTAKSVCSRLGVTGVQLLQEIEPGIPMSRLVGSHSLLAVTKAGAFGQPESLVSALYALKGEVHHV